MVLRRNGSLRIVLALMLLMGFWAVFGTPRNAAAISEGIEISARFSSETVTVGEPTTLLITIRAYYEGTNSLTGGFDLPAGATGGAASATCVIPDPTDVAAGSLTSVLITGDGVPCTISVVMTFATPGVFGPAAWPIDVTSAPFNVNTSGWQPTVTVIAPAPTVCDLAPDMAVSPELIRIAPGGRATVVVTMRNRCPAAETVPGDLLISFSDGLTVVATEGGIVGDGQRAFLRTFTLNGDETRSWTVTVEAGEKMVANPQHVTEHYVGGRVSKRIDGVFIVPEPAPAPVVEVAPAAAPAVAPVPAALPNTAGETAGGAAGVLPLLVLMVVVASAVRRMTANG